MLFKKEDLALNEAMSILENAEYLSEDEGRVDPNAIPVFENARLDTHIVKFDDMIQLSESYGLDAEECLECVAETNELPVEAITVSINEEDSIANPDIVTIFPQVVINPISENSLAYQFCDAMVDAYAESADEDFLWSIIDEAVLNEKMSQEEYEKLDKKFENQKVNSNAWKSYKPATPGAKPVKGVQRSWREKIANAVERHNPFGMAYDVYRNKRDFEGGTNRKEAAISAGKALLRNKDFQTGAKGVAALAVGGLAVKKILGNKDSLLKMADSKPKSWISKKIASLRSIYAKWLRKANMEKNLRRASAMKKVAAAIMNVIDKLMKKLENATA